VEIAGCDAVFANSSFPTDAGTYVSKILYSIEDLQGTYETEGAIDDNPVEQCLKSLGIKKMYERRM
jgi:hypothetical protein